MSRKRYIVHVDMDAFYAAVEQRDNPKYRGKPVIVGADPQEGRGRGVVAACSYEAREYGIHSALPISIAYRKCPHAIFLRGNMRKYVRVSRQVFQVLESFSPDIEPISIDEAFVDISGSYHLFGTPAETCIKIKKAILAATGLTASIGLAPNKMTAKIASDLEKPNGLVIVEEEKLLDFLHPLPVGKLWGVGKRTKEEFAHLGIKTIGDIARRDIQELRQIFGKNGMHIWKLSQGIDPRKVKTVETVKSIGNEHTFSKDELDINTIKDTLMRLSEKVSRRLRKAGFKGKTITLKIRFADFKTYTRAVTLAEPTNFVKDIYQSTWKKAQTFSIRQNPVRLVGIQVSQLSQEPSQGLLFKKPFPETEKIEKLHLAMDEIKEKFGEHSIKHRK